MKHIIKRQKNKNIREVKPNPCKRENKIDSLQDLFHKKLNPIMKKKSQD